jgi:hypothetical protein
MSHTQAKLDAFSLRTASRHTCVYSFLLQLSAALYNLHNPNQITENGPKFGSIDGGCEYQSVRTRYQQR